MRSKIEPAIGTPPARVLLAEDDREMRRLVARRLRRAGHDVIEARDGRDALEHLARERDEGVPRPIEIIVSDIRMPGHDGLQLLASLRAAGSAIPVILITAFGSKETHAAALRLGAAAILDKPFELDELLHAIWARAF